MMPWSWGLSAVAPALPALRLLWAWRWPVAVAVLLLVWQVQAATLRHELRAQQNEAAGNAAVIAVYLQRQQDWQAAAERAAAQVVDDKQRLSAQINKLRGRINHDQTAAADLNADTRDRLREFCAVAGGCAPARAAGRQPGPAAAQP